MKIEKKAIQILKRGYMCNSCLGRQFSELLTGLTNKDRGKVIRMILAMEYDARPFKTEPSNFHAFEFRNKKIKSEPPGKCSICNNLFKNLNSYASEAIKILKNIGFDTFLVGSKLSSELIKKEESLWEDVNIEFVEPLKSELNRELGKIIERRTGKIFKPDNPDVNIILNLERDRIEIKINPLFIYGEYEKLVRGIPQAKWDKYPESVEDIIAKPIMERALGTGHAIHASGREDIDARCLAWRPFVFEVKEPRKRGISLGPIEKSVNKSKKVRVRKLRFSDKREVVRVKDLRPDKTYRILVKFEKPLKNTERIESLAGVISQKTPERVLHRRPDLLRKRNVKMIKLKRIKGLVYEITVRAEAGLYAKELVTGDRGRTTPSVSQIFGMPAEILELDVIKIHRNWASKEKASANDG